MLCLIAGLNTSSSQTNSSYQLSEKIPLDKRTCYWIRVRTTRDKINKVFLVLVNKKLYKVKIYHVYNNSNPYLSQNNTTFQSCLYLKNKWTSYFYSYSSTYFTHLLSYNSISNLVVLSSSVPRDGVYEISKKHDELLVYGKNL